MIRIAIGLFPQAAYQYAWAFIVVAIVSMFYGAIVALLASDLKRMFAYTSISHMGFVLFGAFATVASGNPLGIEGAILLMFTHALAVGALFTLSGFIQKPVRDEEDTAPRGDGAAGAPDGGAPRASRAAPRWASLPSPASSPSSWSSPEGSQPTP